MNSSFNELGISPPILKAIEAMGFESPTEVQGMAIPHILNQEDLIVMSKTGSGKTAVFGIPMLQMTDPGAPGPQGLILTPTRELAVQVDSDLKHMAKYLQHKTTAVFGQHNMNLEIQALVKGVSIVTGTPGRVFDHIRHKNLVTKNIRFLVIDEADRMLDMGFFEQVVRILKTLPRDRVTLVFSATIPPEIRRICRDHMKNPVTIEIESKTMTVDIIQQVYYRVERSEKRTQLNRLLLLEQPESCIIFCNTRIAVDQVQGFLARKGYSSQALHGDIPQGRRSKTIQQFKEGEFHILVATDVAARGLHIDELSLVINYDVPVDKDSYVHRIGRTGRAGSGGRAITLVTGEDIMSLYEIEEHIGAMIPEGDLPSDAVLEKYKFEAEKWIKSKTLVVKPAIAKPVTQVNPVVRPAAKPMAAKPAAAKPMTAKSTVDNTAARPAVSNRPAAPRPTVDRATNATVSAAAKPANTVPTSSPKEATIHVEPVASTESQPALKKKPLLQRIFSKISGK